MLNEQTCIETYKDELENYTLEQLRFKSRIGVWSIGQMYIHLIDVAFEYLANVELCEKALKEQPHSKSEFGKELFELGGFQPIKMQMPVSPENTRNPESKGEIIDGINHVQQKLAEWLDKVNDINPNHKIEHGGFGWLNAREWFDLVEMHFRHHLRQKKELDELLQV